MNQISRHGCQTANRKAHSWSAIFVIYSIFSNRSQMSLFSHKAYDKLQWLEKKWGARWWATAIFQLTELNIKANPLFFLCGHVHKPVLNDAINYAQKGCAMEMWGITLIDEKWKIKHREVAVVGALPNMQTFFTPPQSGCPEF